MGANTEALDDGKYVTMSSLSVVASRATLKAQDITATSVLSAAALTLGGAVTRQSFSTESMTAVQVQDGVNKNPSIAFNSEKSLGLFRSGASTIAMSFGQMRLADGTALLPSFGFTSETSLGLFRSAASQIKMSYGQFIAGDGASTAAAVAFASDPRVGLYRSAASTMAMSGGTLDLKTGSVKLLLVKSTGSIDALADLTDGEFAIAFTNNLTHALAYRSGNTVYKWASTSTVIS